MYEYFNFIVTRLEGNTWSNYAQGTLANDRKPWLVMESSKAFDGTNTVGMVLNSTKAFDSIYCENMM